MLIIRPSDIPASGTLSCDDDFGKTQIKPFTVEDIEGTEVQAYLDHTRPGVIIIDAVVMK